MFFYHSVTLLACSRCTIFYFSSIDFIDCLCMKRYPLLTISSSTVSKSWGIEISKLLRKFRQSYDNSLGDQELTVNLLSSIFHESLNGAFSTIIFTPLHPHPQSIQTTLYSYACSKIFWKRMQCFIQREGMGHSPSRRSRSPSREKLNKFKK
jgi:hypothetical protein